MMPTFPRSSLSFRTAGFPQYGWKAGLSGGAFPHRLFISSWHNWSHAIAADADSSMFARCPADRAGEQVGR
jgi:hypothetical protein